MSRDFDFITFSTDFGIQDPWVGICKARILSINNDANIIDLSHDIPPFDINKGAFILFSSVLLLPSSIHLVVVDPGVGSDRRAIILETARGDVLVGPDNGILLPAAARLGGLINAYEINKKKFVEEETILTYEALTIFSPAVAMISRGIQIPELAEEINKEDVKNYSWSMPKTIDDDILDCQVIDVDRFGSIRLFTETVDFMRLFNSDLKTLFNAKFELSVGDIGLGRFRLYNSYSEAKKGASLLIFDSSGLLNISVNAGSAFEKYNLKFGDIIRIMRLRD